MGLSRNRTGRFAPSWSSGQLAGLVKARSPRSDSPWPDPRLAILVSLSLGENESLKLPTQTSGARLPPPQIRSPGSGSAVPESCGGAPPSREIADSPIAQGRPALSPSLHSRSHCNSSCRHPSRLSPRGHACERIESWSDRGLGSLAQ